MIKKHWLIAAILTFITILAWVGSDIYHTQMKVEIPPKTQEVIEPINPELNIKILELP